jgi:hypothetical protein
MVGRRLPLGYDQGLAHGLTDFDRRTIDQSLVNEPSKIAPALRALVGEAGSVEAALRA